MSDQSGEKQFAPSAKRRADAAKKGDVLRSKELGTAVAMLAGACWLLVAGPWLFEAVGSGARAGFAFERSQLDDFAPGALLTELVATLLPPIATLGLLVVAVTLVSQMAFGEGRFRWAGAAPKGSRLNPLSGLKRMFGPQGLVELGKGVLKLALLGGLAAWWAWDRVADLLALGDGGLTAQLLLGWDAFTGLLLALSVGLGLIALVDVPIQLARRSRRLMMTSQDVKDETKQAEGAPEKRAAIRQRQRQMARGGVAVAMKEAQFVLTNPTHFAVAVAYDPDMAQAPVVLAKGRDARALAMRDMAGEMDIPSLEYPQLARALYFTTRERQVVRAELYVAVARILAFVYSLRRGETPPRPAIAVPVALRFDADGRIERG